MTVDLISHQSYEMEVWKLNKLTYIMDSYFGQKQWFEVKMS